MNNFDSLGFEDLKGRNNYGNTGPVALLVVLLLAAVAFGVYKQFFEKKEVCPENNITDKTEVVKEEQIDIDNFFKNNEVYLGSDKKLYTNENSKLNVSYDKEQVLVLDKYGIKDNIYQIFLTSEGKLYLIAKESSKLHYIEVKNDLTTNKITNMYVTKENGNLNKLIITANNETKEAQLNFTCDKKITSVTLVSYNEKENKVCE